MDLIHTDVCGPFKTATRDANRYYVTFIDDYSRYGYVYLIKHKSETFERFKEFKQEVKNQLSRNIKIFDAIKVVSILVHSSLTILRNVGFSHN